ncbi:MAG: chorismate synthase [Simkaniaceae bacterium]|nr:chorismate synthase [Simkaniaceae bacterium]
MASNSFGNLLKITTWGESHGKGIGVVIDGCPAGISLTDDDINHELALRQPGKTPYTSPRAEKDHAEIYSGVFEGQTTGAPISIVILNKDADSSKYTPIKNLLRPGHANFTYLEKYGIFDYRGGGRSSARETACRVAAGAVAKKILEYYDIKAVAFIKELGCMEMHLPKINDLDELKILTLKSPIFCPEKTAEKKMIEAIEQCIKNKDSVGGIVEVIVENIPVGLGDPVYEKLEANLAKAMMTLPATKGFEIGSGFEAARMKGSKHNDAFTKDKAGKILTKTNFSGGTLGGISSGMPLVFRVAFKPTSSIEKTQPTIDLQGEEKAFNLPEGSRHDPCVTIRAVPVVEAMTALTIADAILLNRTSKIE